MIDQKFKKDSFIYGNFISENLCDEIFKFYNENDKLRTAGKIGADNINESSKKSTEIVLNPTMFFKLFPGYAKSLDKLLKEYLKMYKFADEVSKFNIYDNIKIQHYKPGEGFYKWHYENDGRIHCIQRHLVFMTYLNDLEDGGTEFYYQDLKVPAKKGYTIIWPAGWTHTHRGVISDTQNKTIVTGWFDFEYLSRK